MKHKVYEAIVKAIRAGKLSEPFTAQDFQMACPGFGNGTYNAFLYKHSEGNRGGNSELFERVRPWPISLPAPIQIRAVVRL